jgi:hypothetical protein
MSAEAKDCSLAGIRPDPSSAIDAVIDPAIDSVI